MELESLRNQINAIDNELVKLFCERMEAAAGIAQYKREHNLPVLDQERERQVLNKVAEAAGAEMEDYIISLYNSLFDLSRSYQNRLTAPGTPLSENICAARLDASALFPHKGVVACQGVEGAYSQMACDKLFSLPSIMYFRTFDNVFQAVESGLCQYGLLPIENSSYGSVGSVYDLMQKHHFSIVRSVRLNIDHSLLALPGVKMEQIKEIISHEQALGQCAGFLSALGQVKVTVCENTADAARLVAESGRSDLAAISSASCAELYGLNILDSHVQDNQNNYTRFICIAKDMAIYPGADHISLMFSLPHRPGALYRMISRFSALGVNLTKLESRPIVGRDFEFLFYIDLEASVWSDKIIRLLEELTHSGETFVFLGCYSEI